jgi:UDP-glucose 4-epimerase
MAPTLIIGGAGFIGLEVTRLLLKAGGDVVVLGRGQEPLSLPKGCRYVQGDYANLGLIRTLLQPGCDVVNLAYSTVPKTSFSDPTFDLLSNLPANVALLQEIRHADARRLVIVSSGGTVYGAASTLPIREDHPTNPISPYGITKLTIDSYARMFHATMDLPVLIARPANAYGEAQRSGVGQGFMAAAIDAIQRGREVEIYGPEGTIRDYIHVHDVATGILATLQHGVAGEIYNIGTGIGASNLDLLRLLRDLVEADGFALRVKHLPMRRFDVAANILDSAKLSKATGWSPRVALAEGVAAMWSHRLQRELERGPSP